MLTIVIYLSSRIAEWRGFSFGEE